jgi:hypothetical protein
MRVFRRLATLVVGVAAMGAMVLPAAANASSSTPKQMPFVIQQVNPTTFISPVSTTVQVRPFIAPYKICNNSGPGRCMTAKGNGFQFQMQLSGYSTFSAVVGPDGSLFETPNSLCPQAKDAANGWAVIGNSVCTSTNKSDEWVVGSRLQSAAYSGRYLAVLFNNQDGAKTTAQLGTGAWYLGLYLS